MKKLGALLLTGILSLSMATSALGQEISETTEPEQGVNRLVSGTRQAVVKDILISESGAGIFKKNKNIYLRANHLQFEDGMTVEVSPGDVKVKKVKTHGDTIIITIEQESTEPSSITLKNVKLFLDGSLPVGTYPLELVTEESEEYKDNIFGVNYGKSDEIGKFSTSAVELISDFAIIEEISPQAMGKETLLGTLKKPIMITPGEKEIMVGDKAYTAAQAPYISKEGYVMVPLRSLNQIYPDDIIVKWDDASKTITLIVVGSLKTGDKIVSMKVGENTMDVNGISVAMQGMAELVSGSAFVPLRDFAYLLDCDESDITWDAEKNVATVFAGKVINP